MPAKSIGELIELAKKKTVTTPKRAPLLPDVPAIAEVVSGHENFGWYSLNLSHARA